MAIHPTAIVAEGAVVPLSCTVVSTRRVASDGRIAVTPPTVRKGVPVCCNSDTSDTNFRLMREPSNTVGVNFRPTPNSFSSRVMVVPAVPSRLCATGMKIFPPDRKLAACPLMAMMLGSANTRRTPSFL